MTCTHKGASYYRIS